MKYAKYVDSATRNILWERWHIVHWRYFWLQIAAISVIPLFIQLVDEPVFCIAAVASSSPRGAIHVPISVHAAVASARG